MAGCGLPILQASVLSWLVKPGGPIDAVAELIDISLSESQLPGRENGFKAGSLALMSTV